MLRPFCVELQDRERESMRLTPYCERNLNLKKYKVVFSKLIYTTATVACTPGVQNTVCFLVFMIPPNFKLASFLGKVHLLKDYIKGRRLIETLESLMS